MLGVDGSASFGAGVRGGEGRGAEDIGTGIVGVSTLLGVFPPPVHPYRSIHALISLALTGDFIHSIS